MNIINLHLKNASELYAHGLNHKIDKSNVQKKYLSAEERKAKNVRTGKIIILFGKVKKDIYEEE
jgi:hypothetical protein